MAKVTLTLDTLGEIDGGAARAIIDHEIAAAVADVDDRGHDEQARKVMIQVTLKRDKTGYVQAHVDAQAKLPPRRTGPTVAVVRKSCDRGAELLFQELSPDNPDQSTFPALDEK